MSGRWKLVVPTDTPRTDERANECEGSCFAFGGMTVFARTLERELTAEKERSERLEKENQRLFNSLMLAQRNALGDSNG